MIHHNWHHLDYSDAQGPLPEQWFEQCVQVFTVNHSDYNKHAGITNSASAREHGGSSDDCLQGEQSPDSSLWDSRPRALNCLLFWEADTANMCTDPYHKETQLITLQFCTVHFTFRIISCKDIEDRLSTIFETKIL